MSESVFASAICYRYDVGWDTNVDKFMYDLVKHCSLLGTNVGNNEQG